MNIKKIQDSIKLSLNIIAKAIKQLPTDKKEIISSRINLVLNKHLQNNNQQQQNLKKFLKDLEFNINFIKLSNPQLDYTPQPIAQDNLASNNSQKNSAQQKKQSDQNQHKFKITNQQQIEIERMPNDTFDQQQKIQKQAREQVEFSNWFDGNVDPELLRKHKQLLQRQHFAGQFWKGKQKPKNNAIQYLKLVMANTDQTQQMPKKDKVLNDFMPSNIDTKDQVWQKVKR